MIGSLGPSIRFFWENADVFPTFILSAVFGYVGTLYAAATRYMHPVTVVALALPRPNTSPFGIPNWSDEPIFNAIERPCRYFTLTIKNFGAMVAVVLGIVRKALNIVCSFAIFPKPFNWVYVVAGLLFFAGLFELQAGKSFWRSNSAKRENIS